MPLLKHHLCVFPLETACSGGAPRLLVLFDPLLLSVALGKDDKAEQSVGHDKPVLLLPSRRQRGGLGDNVSESQAAANLEQLFEVSLGIHD